MNTSHEIYANKIRDKYGEEFILLSEYSGRENTISVRHNTSTCGHEFSITARVLLNKGNCKKCNGTHRMSHEEFVEKLLRITNNEYYLLSPYVTRKKQVLMKHNDPSCQHEWKVSPSEFLGSEKRKGTRCPQCFGAKKKTTEEFKAEIKNLVGDEYVLLTEYKSAHEKIVLLHNIADCGYEWVTTRSVFLNGHRCGKCSGLMRKDSSQYSKEVLDIVGDEYTVLGEYLGNKKPIRMRHNNTSCGNYEWDIAPHSFQHLGTRCPSCYGNIQKAPQQFKKEVEELYSGEFQVVGEYKSKNTKVKMLHRTCGEYWFVNPGDILHKGSGCPTCKESKGEKKIRNLLTEYKLKFESQFKIKGCKNKRLLPFDFAVKDENNQVLFLIEYQGNQHFEPTELFGGMEAFEERCKNDKIKKQFCETNRIPLLIIHFQDYGNMNGIISNFIKNDSIEMT